MRHLRLKTNPLEKITSYFSQYGEIEDLRLFSKSKGKFGFITFKKPETVQKIFADGNDHFIGNIKVRCNHIKEENEISKDTGSKSRKGSSVMDGLSSQASKKKKKTRSKKSRHKRGKDLNTLEKANLQMAESFGSFGAPSQEGSKPFPEPFSEEFLMRKNQNGPVFSSCHGSDVGSNDFYFNCAPPHPQIGTKLGKKKGRLTQSNKLNTKRKQLDQEIWDHDQQIFGIFEEANLPSSA